MTTQSSSSSPIGPVERAFTLLQAVVSADGPVGVRELGRRTGLPRSTTSRLVSQLCGLGMVERTADGLVVPGSALATLSVRGGPQPLLRDRLRPLLNTLLDDHGENVALAVDDGDAVLYVSQIDSHKAVKAPDVRAERHPFHVVAHGLALMAYWPRRRLADYLQGPLVGPTAESVTDPAAITERLGQVRADGFVWTIEEFDAGVNGLATVIERDGEPLASVGVYGPSYRLSPEHHPDLAQRLVQTVRGQTPALL